MTGVWGRRFEKRVLTVLVIQSDIDAAEMFKVKSQHGCLLRKQNKRSSALLKKAQF